ncbi:MAG: YABBY transcription factor [Candidatus Bathyarchaeota archaeon]|nr:YABBY transcription factor [Candidatus Bathyarchaeota archaeon]
MVKVEGTLDELRALFVEAAKQEARATAKRAGKKVVKKAVKTAKRAPSAYNKYMKKELARLKKAHPRMSHQARFKKAAKSWKGRKKK